MISHSLMRRPPSRALPRGAVFRRAAAPVAIGLALMIGGIGPAPREAGAAGPVVVRAAAGSVRSRDAHNRRVRVHNQTGWTMTRFYALAARSNAREANLLGVEALASGSSWALDLDDGSGACIFDFRAEFANSQTLIRQGVNVCQIADYYFTR